MNIITGRYDNSRHNLAIVVYPPLELRHPHMEARMMEYTTFYAHRFNQLRGPHQPIPIYTAASIDEGMAKYSDRHDHILFMATGCRIYDMSILFDIVAEIEANPRYLAAAHILDWGPQWYELHQQFILVNSRNWVRCGVPPFGGWEPGTENLPVIERSPENFHDDYTPLWIRFTGEYQPTYHSHPGWSYLLHAAKHGMTVINWQQHIRLKRTYYYPEDHSDEFLESLRTLTDCGVTNRNQATLIKQLRTVRDQVWLLNSEDMALPPNRYDTVALTASGFKFLEVFNRGLLNPGGGLVIYDFNPLSLQWIRLLYEGSEDVPTLMATFQHRHQFKILGGEVYGKEGGLTQHFHSSFQATLDYFGGLPKFTHLLQQWRQHPTQFVHCNLYDRPHELTDNFRGHTLLNVSNIFCTDFSNAYYGMAETHRRWEALLASLPTSTHIVGHDAHCQAVDGVYGQ